MIEALKDDELMRKVGGKFRLASMIQRRWCQLMDGARPLVERAGRTDLEIVVEEIRQGLLTYERLTASEMGAAPAEVL
ncbi:MAG: DNA-directed RNA polymerase subunit omega [Phycisphaerales bacterium]|nr:DNA-directed RNA polymerase subunit omega [Phycisphaerales bacterium]